jgi:CheY-like chemotaxis protein
MRIVVVDDNAVMRKVLGALLAAAGHEVVGAFADGDGLEESLQHLRPEVVCLDYQLPGRDGMALLRAIHALLPEIDVLFTTAASGEGLEAQAADAGASGFIAKPYSQQQIADELKTVEAARQAAVARAVRTTDNYGRAVIADDSASVRLLLKGLLEECGLEVVHSVADGAEAIAAVRQHQPRVLCLDVNMPVLGGLEALPQIRLISPETSVVMITTSLDKVVATQAARQGAVGYILKPLRLANVQGFMKKLLAR